MENVNENRLENDFIDAPAATSTGAKRTPGEVVKEHWFKILLGLVILIFAGLFFWLKSAQKAAEQKTMPVAAASENIEQAIPEAKTDILENKTPSAILEEQRKAEQEAQYTQPGPSEEEVVNAFVVDTAGQAARKRYQLQLQKRQEQQARSAALEVDTIETTVQDQSTGQYRTSQIVVPRNNNRSRNGVRSTARSTSASAYDTDGTPFETNQEVLRMLASSSPQTRQVYEQTTGKRYRDPGLVNAAKEAQAALPGADGFNTYKVANTRFNSASTNNQVEALTPDVFYKCVISGEQKVRTGSVVIMRLLEDAVVSGVTFPKNMTFAGIAKVESNRVTVQIDRLGPTRVKADIFDFNYMPGIMIDPEKKIAKDVDRGLYDMQRQTGQEISTAIDRSASGANSVVGVAGRVAANAVSRPKTRQRLRDVLLPDGYPILITSAAAGQMATGSGTN
ncbi:conjugative transposon protein TraM [Adhaeribacter aquaticus]|uniref:conjugative transposon protein TraM n=1 Tax=Adhaeribacter aquaticus TaxID=299567 RepID=UPI0004009C99|nr:conjugative transposon protein TraM [Adhaeribacter aquaticus]